MLQHCLIMKQKGEKKVTPTTEKSPVFYTSAFPVIQMTTEANRQPDKEADYRH